ncbi:helix-turn-helix domain-containing protein [uncultured Bradyrhizobium sp.]|jgi:DNA-binding IclR family transcriptional regulator|uniref:IclR family transcriptional regulator n=1 Tax=uncultured Bradyrhizobium sp. TaxID=199684 RepID=UPI002617405A|nr:helix-turn-helix domain-containing protein [uncultured Bradyrhizobium sp.]
MLKTQGVATVQRTLAILDSFIGSGTRSLAEIAKITGLAKPTVMRSLVSLYEAGYVVRLSDGRYALGAKTFQLGSTYRANFNLEHHVLPALQQLSEQTLESSAFHVRERDQRLCLFRVDSPQLVRDVARPANLAPLDLTSTGQVLSTAHWADRIGGGAQIFVSSGVYDTVTASLSTAVFGHEGALVGAMTVSGPIERIRQADLEALASRLTDASHRLSLVLGAPLPRESGGSRIINLPSAETSAR